jgi:hypothetical protein
MDDQLSSPAATNDANLSFEDERNSLGAIAGGPEDVTRRKPLFG